MNQHYEGFSEKSLTDKIMFSNRENIGLYDPGDNIDFGVFLY